MLGETIKNLRKDKELTQEELGKILGVSGRNIGYYESNQRMPPADILTKISDYFNVSVDYLLCKSENLKFSKSQLPKELQDLDVRYLKLAKKMQLDDIPPETIEKMIETIKTLKK